ncbi:MAG: hypothetical protein GVY12_14775 [Bacteroidetes bacterium]|jgi:hypothetical protein|nr:hypothetical protein [Bacteroidota bacterium]
MVTRVDTPAPLESAQPQLHTAGDTLWLSWVAPTSDTTHALRYAAFNGGTWGPAGTVAEGGDWFVNWADVPSVRTLPDGRKTAHYLVSNGPNIFAYDVRIAQTDDARTWQEAITPHDDGTQTEHGFVSMMPWQGDLMAVWLDGREMNLNADDAEDHGSGAMTLRAGLVDARGTGRASFLIDDRVCECCPTTGVETNDGLLIAYRDRTDDNIRNISLARYDGERWSAPYTLHDDGWRLDGCPVNGPSLAAQGDTVVASWFTAAENKPRVYAAFSTDGGRTFGDPLVMDDDRPNGQVSAVLLADDQAVVGWHARTDGGDVFKLRRVTPTGPNGRAHVVVENMPPVRAGIPRMVHFDEDLFLAWTATTDDARRVAFARLQLP